MKVKIIKFFADFEKEEKWLNEMSAKGLQLIDFSWPRYLFEEGTPGEYSYRLELLNDYPSHGESKAYIKFMEESGVELVASHFRWVFFRKKVADGPFDIYSDIDSKINHYKKVLTLVGTAGGINLVPAAVNITNALHSSSHNGSTTLGLISIANLAVVLFLTPVFTSYFKKMNKLKKEKEIFES